MISSSMLDINKPKVTNISTKMATSYYDIMFGDFIDSRNYRWYV